MRWMRWGDAIPAVIVLLAATLMPLWRLSSAVGACVRVQTADTAFSVSLSQDARYPLDSGGYSLTLVVENGRAFVTDATCPDRVCEHTGAIARTAESIACVPAAVILTVEGELAESMPDGVTR